MSSRIVAAVGGTAVALGAFSALAAVATAASAAPAHHAAAHHAPAHHRTHVHHKAPRHHVNTRGATHDLTQELARLTRLQSGVAGDTRISSTDAAALAAALGRDAAAVKADLAALSGATTQKQVNVIVGAAHTAGMLAGGQYVVVLQAGATEARIETVAAQQETLSAQVQAAATTGHDMTVENGQLADLANRLTEASADVDGAVTSVLAVDPTSSRTAALQALAASRAGLAKAATAVAAAAADAAAVTTELAALPAPAPAPVP